MKLQTDVIETTQDTRLFASLPLLLHDLATYIDDKSSGNFFIVTDDNCSCRFALKEGKITHCAFKRFKGHAALEAIMTSNIRGVARFMQSRSPLYHDKESIDHDYVVDTLNITQLDLSNEDALSNEDKKYITYRGQRAEARAHQTTSPSSLDKPQSRRMYRGQIVND